MRALLLIAASLHSEPIAMKYVAEIGRLAGKSVSLGGATARGLADGAVRIQGRDRAGKTWSLRFTPADGAGWTTVWSADFDADRQQDLLIARLNPFGGGCNGEVSITLLLFDKHGRPAPLRYQGLLPRGDGQFPYLPVTANRVAGRAEFALKGCDGVLSAIRPSVGSPPNAKELIEVLSLDMPPSNEAVLDGPDGREIVLDNTFPALLRMQREGYRVYRGGDFIWADLYQPPAPRTVTAQFETSAREEIAVSPKPTADGCFTIALDWAVRLCQKTGLWSRANGGTREELLLDKQTVRTDHTAMGQTVSGSTRYARPGLLGVVPLEDDWELAQWADGSMLIKDGVFEKVQLSHTGTLVRLSEGFGFLNGDRVTAVRGRFVWRR